MSLGRRCQHRGGNQSRHMRHRGLRLP
jgi:hypothetical protein